MEKVLCAAYHLDNGVPFPNQPVKTGIVFCGLNQSAILEQMIPFKISIDQSKQGFLTSHGRFVSREEAVDVASKAGQLPEGFFRRILYSEDLCY